MPGTSALILREFTPEHVETDVSPRGATGETKSGREVLRLSSASAVPVDLLSSLESGTGEVHRYFSLNEALARIQEKTNIYFPAPKEFTYDEANALSWADHLLHGETVMGTWRQATMTLRTTDNGRSFLADQKKHEAAAYLFAQQQAIVVADHVIDLGVVGTHFLSGSIKNFHNEGWSNETVTLTLIPGESDEYETWLITSEASIQDTIPGVSRRFRQQTKELMKRNDELLRRLARL